MEPLENMSFTEASLIGSESIHVLVTVMQNKHNDVRSPNHITGKMAKEYNSEPYLRKKILYLCYITKLLSFLRENKNVTGETTPWGV